MVTLVIIANIFATVQYCYDASYNCATGYLILEVAPVEYSKIY